MIIRLQIDEELAKKLRVIKDRVSKKLTLPKFIISILILVIDEIEKDEKV